VAAAEAKRWLVGTLIVTGGGLVAAIALAPSDEATAGAALSGLLFVGSSLHVAASGWLLAIPEVRAHAGRHRTRYVIAPLSLIVMGALAAAAVDPGLLEWLLLAFFGWQFLHFQRQNLGLAALAASSQGVAGLRSSERTVLLVAGRAGTLAILSRPRLLGLTLDPGIDFLFSSAAAVFVVAALAAGRIVATTRRRDERPSPFVAVYGMAFAFWLPVFLFRSPYPAIGGLVMAHGLQYLLLTGLVAIGEPRQSQSRHQHGAALPATVLALLVGATALSASSHLHAAGASTRWLYGAYLGVVASHFVVDAGLWRLRDTFPREFLASRVPYLLSGSRSAADIECRT
jgi:MFS family permease